MTAPQPLALPVESGLNVSALLERPPDARALFVLGHGAGAGIRHPFLSDLSRELAIRRIASLRFQFPYMERRSRRPDPPAVCHATVRAAIEYAADMELHLPLFAGGKSFGGRMTSQAQALAPLRAVRGLAFVGFPLHQAKRPSIVRADHLSKIRVPLLFLQGTRDELAEPALMREVVERLGARARMVAIDGADHAFHVRVRSGRTDSDVLSEIADALEAWIGSVLRTSPD